MSGRVIHFGKYEGSEIERVIEIDPEYILWAVDNVKGHGISQLHISRARNNLDDTDDSLDDALHDLGVNWYDEVPF